MSRGFCGLGRAGGVVKGGDRGAGKANGLLKDLMLVQVEQRVKAPQRKKTSALCHCER